jgi:hypothetical protein
VDRTTAMAADLGNLVVTEGNPIAPVPRSNDVRNIAFVEATLLERLSECVFCGAMDICTGIDQCTRNDSALIVNYNGLRLS